MQTNIAQAQTEIVATCLDCGMPFAYKPLFVGSTQIKLFFCDKCANKRKAAFAAKLANIANNPKSALAKAFLDSIPTEFANTDPSLLPDQTLYKNVMAWKFNPKGLVIYGPSGSGKSRCAYQLLKREASDSPPKSCMAISATDMSAYPAKIADNPTKANAWLQSALNADILLLDDIFKSSMTERVQEAIFIIIDHRTSNQLPIIATLNEKSSTIEARLTPDRAIPVIRRLKQFCSIIKAANPQPNQNP